MRLAMSCASACNGAASSSLLQPVKSAVCNCLNTRGGLASSIMIGTSFPRRRASLASASTQSEATECRDQTTITQRALPSAVSMTWENFSPVRIAESHHTDQPRVSNAATRA